MLLPATVSDQIRWKLQLSTKCRFLLMSWVYNDSSAWLTTCENTFPTSATYRPPCENWHTRTRYPQHQRAFDTLKPQLASAPILAYFTLELPVTLTCEATQYGLGAVRADGDFNPVSYESRTLSDTEQRFAQIEKELLTVVFACT